MATIISHGIAAIALGKACTGERRPWKFWVTAAVCAMLPDLDVLGFRFGVHYDDLLGHRGFTHSLFFALLLSFMIVAVLFREAPAFSPRWLGYLAFFFFCTASHGVLDAFTNGGLGVAFFSPFSNARYFFPWTPIEVSPIGLRRFTGNRAWEVILSELFWIWIPAALMILIAWLVRKFTVRQNSIGRQTDASPS